MNIANEFTGLPMEDLIGAPLAACCRAQVNLANATADFIERIGFEQSQGGKLEVRNVNFSFFRPKKDESATQDAGGGAQKPAEFEKVSLEVPLLAIVNVPALTIKTVDITFDMEVSASTSHKDSRDSEKSLTAKASGGWGPVSASVELSGKVSTHQENTRTTDKSAKYHVEVHARDDGMPEGLSRVLDMMHEAIAPRSVEAAPPYTPPEAKQGAAGGAGGQPSV